MIRFLAILKFGMRVTDFKRFKMAVDGVGKRQVMDLNHRTIAEIMNALPPFDPLRCAWVGRSLNGRFGEFAVMFSVYGQKIREWRCRQHPEHLRTRQPR